MTAAIADQSRHTAPNGAPRRRGSSRSEPVRRPHLVPVPDSEPPLDPEPAPPAVAHLDPTRSAASTRSVGTDDEMTTSTVGTDAALARRPSGRPDPTGPNRVAPARPPIRRVAPARRAAPARSLVPPQRACPPRPRRAPQRVTVVSAESVPGWSNDADVGVRMTSSIALPPAHATGAALARALLEVLTGCRPAAQLRTHCAPDVFAGLQDTSMLGERGSARLLATQVCEPADGVAELSAVFRCAGRVRAMALRLQGVDGRWRLTALQLG